MTTDRITHSHRKLDRCCKSSGFDQDIQQLVFDSKDTIERISCDITKELFLKKYVMKREPVMLQGCQRKWKAKKWTFKGMFQFS